MKNIAVYGAGAFGKLFIKSLDRVDFIIDDYTSEKFFNSIPIKKLKDIPKETEVYISVLQHSNQIENRLKKAGFKNINNFTNSILKIPNIIKEIAKTNYLWLVEDTSRMVNEKKVRKLIKLLSDKKSKKIVSKMVMLRQTFDPKYYIKPQGVEYFCDDIKIFKNLKNINFVDCGAYIGDTIEELFKHSKNITSTISFEPDSSNLKKLRKNLSKLQEEHQKTNFFVYPSGVYKQSGVLKFANNGIDSSAGFNEDSDTIVPVVSLDEVILNSNPNFIKMDIEGAEKDAILGSSKTIKKYKPILAICLYHKPEDLWELPLLINKIEPNYDMYIRVHEDLCLSTVLYCIPR
jgi:FkbM family methyltransferase